MAAIYPTTYELYRIQDDPGQLYDVSRQEQELRVRMSEQMHARWNEIKNDCVDWERSGHEK